MAKEKDVLDRLHRLLDVLTSGDDVGGGKGRIMPKWLVLIGGSAQAALTAAAAVLLARKCSPVQNFG